MQRMLKAALKELNDKEFKNFKRELLVPDNLDGQQSLGKAALQTTDTMDTIDLILQKYPNNVAQIMVNVFKEIERTDLQKTFEDIIDSGKSATSSQGSKTGTAASVPEVDFVTKHRGALIQRVSMVDAILDLLVDEGVMQAEDYGEVRAAPTSVKKMRELFVLLDKRGVKAKCIFYKGLEKNEACLLDDLKSQ